MRQPARAARETTWMLRIESPPSSKKLSWTPTAATPSASCQKRARKRSSSLRGAAGSRPGVEAADAAAASGAGSARRSTLPLAVSGSAGSGTKSAGSM